MLDLNQRASFLQIARTTVFTNENLSDKEKNIVLFEVLKTLIKFKINKVY